MAVDPRELIEHSPMSGFQWRVVAIMVGLTALDGFDVLSISFASPGIAQDWGIDRAALGIVLSMELVGMAIGSVLLGGVADKVGRRATILGCLAIMTCGMFGAATADEVVGLSLWRVGTGLGIGGMLAATNAAVAEVANGRHRAMCVVLMAAGYPLGNIAGGSVSAWLLTTYSWQAVFIFGGIATLLFVPIVLAGAPESIAFLIHRRRPDALERVNRTLARMGHPPVDRLPDAAAEPPPPPVTALFASDNRRKTALLTLAYFAHVMSFYFILKWIPKIVADMGFEPSSAAGVLVWASVGGLAGSLTLGLLTQRVRVLWLTVAAMILSAFAIIAFGRVADGLASLSAAALVAGFATNAGMVGLYALVAGSFQTGLRATATGFVIGVGRGGSALAPAMAGLLFAAGYGLPSVALFMALGSIFGAAALLGMRRRTMTA